MKKILTIIILCSVFVFSCNDDYLDIESTQYVTADQLSAETVQPLITGLYEWLIKYNSHNRTGKLKPRHIDFGLMALHWRTDLMNDDMIMVNKGYHWGFTDYNFTGRDAGDVDVAFFWNYLYKMIKASNRILTNVPEKIKADQKPIYGQAYAFRGLGYHYLVRCFAHTYIGHQQDPGVPIITEKTTQEQILNNPRAKVEEVYKQIKSDYDKASELLAGWTRANKSIIDQSVVEGFKARMYLEMEQYGEAIKCAQKVISLTDCQLMSRDDYKSGFNDIGNVEWIWGAIVTKESQIATSGIINFFSHISTTAYGYVAAGAMWKAIDARLYNAIPATDVRKEVFLSEPKEVITPWGPKTADKYVNMKFLPLPNSSQDEDMPFMRLAEIYLIMAEAKAMNGDADAASAAHKRFTFKPSTNGVRPQHSAAA